MIAARMVRTNFHMPPKYLVALRKLSRRTGLTVADLVRRAVESYLQKERKDKDTSK